MRGNGCANVRRGFVDELHGITGGDVFEHHLEGRETFHDTTHVLIDEDFFAIEHVDITASDLTVDQQRHADFGHGLQRRENLVDAGDTGIGVGGGASGVQLGGMDEAAGLGLANLFGLGDRKSVVSGKSGSVRVDHGGRRIIKKKINNTHVFYNSCSIKNIHTHLNIIYHMHNLN